MAIKRTAMKPSTVALKSAGFSRSSRIEAREVSKAARKPVTEVKVRMRKCAVKSCRAPFEPRSMTHKCCGPACAADFAASERVRKERSERQEGLRKLKRKADYVADAQRAFNAAIRERDRQAGHACISSGKRLDWSGNNVDAGHYRSVGSAPHLRFNEDNVHAQSKQENRYASGNAVDYRIGLIARIGIARVDALESNQAPRHYTIDDLIAITTHYRAKLRVLKSESAAAVTEAPSNTIPLEK